MDDGYSRLILLAGVVLLFLAAGFAIWRFIRSRQENVTEEDIKAFAKGVTLDDGYETMPAELIILKSDEISEIELTIHEGKFHQVKRMFESVDKKVIYLKRLSMGKLKLDENLALGEYRELTDEEVKMIEERD